MFSALIIWLGDWLGLDLEHIALLGAALGGVLGLVPHSLPIGKLGGFVVGFVVAWVGFALRAAVLPDSSSGRAVAAFLVVAVIAAACGVSAGRLPLWSGLLGAAAIVGAYEETYTNAPSQFLQDSPTAGSTVLFAVALGYLATSLVAEGLPTPAAGASSWNRWFTRAEPNPAAGDDAGGIDDILSGESK
ncbi:hypothetical protein GKE56_03880 [Nostocoides sp. HKS02]|nr:hypothetical protein GKE56_03880 [Tetrasphaera sp. HKS02]